MSKPLHDLKVAKLAAALTRPLHAGDSVAAFALTDTAALVIETVSGPAAAHKGLSGLRSIPDGFGLLFPTSRSFVMRDCLMDIGLISVDPATLRLVAAELMYANDPRRVHYTQGVGLEVNQRTFYALKDLMAVSTVKLKRI